MSRTLTNCENLASLAHSSNARKGKCLFSQISVYVHIFPQLYPPLLALEKDIVGGGAG